MKIANLPNKKTIKFADEMDDGSIDEIVRKIIAVDGNSGQVAMMGELVTTLAQSFAMLAQNNAQLTQAVVGIANSMAALDKSLRQGNSNLEQMALLLSQKLDTIAAVYGAPRELVKDGEGKPTGVKIKVQ